MNHRRKRNSRNSQQKIVYEDDLAVAARAAAADTRYLHTTQDFSQMRSNDVNVRNINGSSSNMSDDVDNANCISYLVPYGTSSEEENEDDDIDNISESSSSDDESDIDLTEALSKMVAGDQEDECESGKRIRIRTSSLQGPKTAHELETYGSSSVLAVTIAMTSDQLSKVSPSDLGIAGNVKFHLVNERTVVVESLVGHLPLDEGSLLVLYEKVDQENAEEIFLLGNVVRQSNLDSFSFCIDSSKLYLVLVRSIWSCRTSTIHCAAAVPIKYNNESRSSKQKCRY